MRNKNKEPDLRDRMQHTLEKRRIAAVKRVSELWSAQPKLNKKSWAELERAIDALTVAHLALSLRYPVIVAPIESDVAR
jgi:hypothetical protein